MCVAWISVQFKPDPRFEEAKTFIRTGVFGAYNFSPLLDSLEGDEGFGRADYFLVGKDFPSYIECQEKVDEAYRDQQVSNFAPFPDLLYYLVVADASYQPCSVSRGG